LPSGSSASNYAYGEQGQTKLRLKVPSLRYRIASRFVIGRHCQLT
jgi:hypothetical protein